MQDGWRRVPGQLSCPGRLCAAVCRFRVFAKVSCVFDCNCVFEYFVDSVPDHAAQIWYTCGLGRVLKQEETSINARRLLFLSAAVHGMILCEKDRIRSYQETKIKCTMESALRRPRGKSVTKASPRR